MLGVLVALALLLDGADILARHYATDKVAARIKAREPTAHGVSVHIRSFPFLKLLANGHVDEIGARIASLQVGALVFAVDVELHGLKVQQTSLFQGQVNVKSLRTGTVTVTVTATALSKALGKTVTLGSGGITLRLTNRTLVIAGGLVASYALPGPDVLPCAPALSVNGQTATLSCAFTQVPSTFASLGT
jgi:hypothetical protein